MCHIAFWEPMMGAEFDTDEEWKKQPYRKGMKLHPMTIEQNAITSFKESNSPSTVHCKYNWAWIVFTVRPYDRRCRRGTFERNAVAGNVSVDDTSLWTG